MFSYVTKEFERPQNTNVVRYGSFEINGNVLTVNFVSAKGSDYDRPKKSDKSIPESLCIKIEIEEIAESKIMVRDIETTEHTLIIKQISGKNLFEVYNENTTIEFVARYLIND